MAEGYSTPVSMNSDDALSLDVTISPLKEGVTIEEIITSPDSPKKDGPRKKPPQYDMIVASDCHAVFQQGEPLDNKHLTEWFDLPDDTAAPFYVTIIQAAKTGSENRIAQGEEIALYQQFIQEQLKGDLTVDMVTRLVQTYGALRKEQIILDMKRNPEQYSVGSPIGQKWFRHCGFNAYNGIWKIPYLEFTSDESTQGIVTIAVRKDFDKYKVNDKICEPELQPGGKIAIIQALYEMYEKGARSVLFLNFGCAGVFGEHPTHKRAIVRDIESHFATYSIVRAPTTGQKLFVLGQGEGTPDKIQRKLEEELAEAERVNQVVSKLAALPTVPKGTRGSKRPLPIGINLGKPQIQPPGRGGRTRKRKKRKSKRKYHSVKHYK